jgi:translation initiation factor IF-2
MFANRASQTIEFPLVVKADEQGSSEANRQRRQPYLTEDIKARILHAGVGASRKATWSRFGRAVAPIIGFNVARTPRRREIAEPQQGRVPLYDVIYHLTIG